MDAFPVGISAIPSQQSKHRDVNYEQVIAYASPALSDVEKRYSLTEKEALATVWAVEHFHKFLFGSEFAYMNNRPSQNK